MAAVMAFVPLLFSPTPVTLASREVNEGGGSLWTLRGMGDSKNSSPESINVWKLLLYKFQDIRRVQTPSFTILLKCQISILPPKLHQGSIITAAPTLNQVCKTKYVIVDTMEVFEPRRHNIGALKDEIGGVMQYHLNHQKYPFMAPRRRLTRLIQMRVRPVAFSITMTSLRIYQKGDAGCLSDTSPPFQAHCCVIGSPSRWVIGGDSFQSTLVKHSHH